MIMAAALFNDLFTLCIRRERDREGAYKKSVRQHTQHFISRVEKMRRFEKRGRKRQLLLHCVYYFNYSEQEMKMQSGQEY